MLSQMVEHIPGLSFFLMWGGQEGVGGGQILCKEHTLHDHVQTIGLMPMETRILTRVTRILARCTRILARCDAYSHTVFIACVRLHP
jgi:hypothetical protein